MHFRYSVGAEQTLSELRVSSGHYNISVVLVDARAGIVLFQQTNQFSKGESPHALDLEALFEPLRSLVSSP